MDLGTGDGRAVLATAASRPDRLVVGIDPVAAAMAEASRRAAAPLRRGGLPHARFVVASAEALPPGVTGIADLVTVTLPWGSLLRGALVLDDVAAAGIASLVGPNGQVEMLLAPAARDSLGDGVDVAGRLAGSLEADWLGHGLELVGAAPASPATLAAGASTWARRLRLGTTASSRERVAWQVSLRRPSKGHLPSE